MTLTSNEVPAATGVVGKDAVVHPQLVFTLLMSRGLSPLFVIVNKAVTGCLNVTCLQSMMVFFVDIFCAWAPVVRKHRPSKYRCFLIIVVYFTDRDLAISLPPYSGLYAHCTVQRPVV